MQRCKVAVYHLLIAVKELHHFSFWQEIMFTFLSEKELRFTDNKKKKDNPYVFLTKRNEA